VKVPVKLSLGACALVFCALSSCDDGIQHGKYVQGASVIVTLEPLAFLHIVTGHRTDGESEILGSEENLLYVMFMFPEIPGANVGSGMSTNRYISKFDHGITPVGQPTRSFEYRWDRRRHTLSVGNQVFDIENGNLFVLHWDLKAEFPEARQGGPVRNIGLIKKGLEAQPLLSVMDAFRRAFPSDAEVQKRQWVEKK
jgi:hypothetical protein